MLYELFCQATQPLSSSDEFGLSLWRWALSLLTIGGGAGILGYLHRVVVALNVDKVERQTNKDDITKIKAGAERDMQQITARANEQLAMQVEAYKRDADHLKKVTEDYRDKVDTLENQVRFLQKELERIVHEKSQLSEKLEALAAVNEEFAACRQECARYTEKAQQHEERIRRLVQDQAANLATIEILERERSDLISRAATSEERAKQLQAKLDKYAPAEAAVEHTIREAVKKVTHD